MAIQATTADEGRLLISEVLIQLLTHVAVGTGNGTTAPDPTGTGLAQEIGRALYLERAFVVADASGSLHVGSGAYRIVPDSTNLMYLRFRFEEADALGQWSELALIGGGVAFISRGADIVDGPQAGDDRAHMDVLLGGAFSDSVNQNLTITITQGGGSGVAQFGWHSTTGASGSATVVFGTPIALGATGLTVVFTGGTDGVLTLGDQWTIRATTDPDSPTFAAHGVYDAVANLTGQVQARGRTLQLVHMDPPAPKGPDVVDIQLVVEVLRT